MNHPLDSSRLKIIRAQEHVDFLDDKVGEYLSTNPYEFIVKIHGQDRIPLFRPKGSPPLYLSAIIGDCLYNLRAALDLLIWQLALIGPKADRLSDKTRLYFPIFSHDEKFKKQRHDTLQKWLRADVLAALDDVQPYQTGYETLAVLHTLANQDKHRLPVLTVNIPTTGRISHSASTDTGFTIGATRSYIAGTHQFDTELTFPPLNIGEDVQVNGQAAGFIAFADLPMPREPVEIVLGNILTCIKDSVLPKFEPFFATLPR